jgi:hypothetical protein
VYEFDRLLDRDDVARVIDIDEINQRRQRR